MSDNPTKKSHVNKRAQERYGVSVNHGQRESLERQITSGRAELLERRGIARVYLCWLPDGKRCRAVYNRIFKKIVTLLPPTPDESRKA